ncbi:MAG: hypothetical protein ACYDDI_17070 [Candidatus Acidiferrales bacterium]
MKFWFALDPTGTLPNPTLEGLAESAPTAGFGFGEAALVRPEHPDKPEAMTIPAMIIKMNRLTVYGRTAEGAIAGIRLVSMV